MTDRSEFRALLVSLMARLLRHLPITSWQLQMCPEELQINQRIVENRRHGTPAVQRRARLANWAVTAAVIVALVIAASGGSAQFSRSTTQGRAVTTHPGLLDCSQVSGSRIAQVGKIRSSNGQEWVTPAETNWREGPRLTDLYNDCLDVRRANVRELDIDSVPVQEIDADGEVITGYLFGDNYAELYVNGALVGVDSTPYTPFNSSVVRFRVKRPITYAVKLVDWEENLGLGTESLGSDAYHPGDGGFIASFSDGTVTDNTWRAQSYYIAPLSAPDEVVERGNVHDTSALGTYYPTAASNADCADRCYAVRYPIPSDWITSGFDDAIWPAAVEFTERQVGTGDPAFQNFRPQLTAGGATFIWSSNLIFDNLVLARKTVP